MVEKCFEELLIIRMYKWVASVARVHLTQDLVLKVKGKVTHEMYN